MDPFFNPKMFLFLQEHVFGMEFRFSSHGSVRGRVILNVPSSYFDS